MRRAIPIVLLLLIAGAYVGYRIYLSRRPYEWSGTVEVRTVDVGSRTGGRVAKVLVREGDHVAAGQPLVVLEVGDLEAQRLIARGQLLQAQAALEKLRTGARPEEIEQAKARTQTASAALDMTRTGPRREEIAAAEEQLAAAQATADKAQLDADRARRLVESGAIARAEADQAETLLRSARAQRNAQAKVVEELHAGTRIEEIRQAAARQREAAASGALVVAGARSEDVKAADATVMAAQGRVDQIEVLLAELTVRSPVAARVDTLDLRPGDLLAPNAAAARLVEDDALYVRIYVPETQLGHVAVGQEVGVQVDTWRDRRFKGKVESISGVGEYSPRNLQTSDERADQVFAARIGLVEGQGQVRAGMAALIEVPR
jgi:multidrug resistance efflux pump